MVNKGTIIIEKKGKTMGMALRDRVDALIKGRDRVIEKSREYARDTLQDKKVSIDKKQADAYHLEQAKGLIDRLVMVARRLLLVFKARRYGGVRDMDRAEALRKAAELYEEYARELERKGREQDTPELPKSKPVLMIDCSDLDSELPPAVSYQEQTEEIRKFAEAHRKFRVNASGSAGSRRKRGNPGTPRGRYNVRCDMCGGRHPWDEPCRGSKSNG